MLAPPRRPLIVLSVIVLLAIILFISSHHEPTTAKLEKWLPSIGPNNAEAQWHRGVRRRTNALRQKCAEPDVFEKMYGRTNIRMSRGYEGSLYRIERFVDKILRGESVTFSAIGGSVTKGHHVQELEIWVNVLGDWLKDWFPHAGNITVVNGAVPATGSGYFSYCFPLHIPEESDLVVIELGVNDEPDPEMIDNMEALLRGVLSLPFSPAVIVGEAMAFSMGQMSGGGGRYHLPVAQYYDVPVMNQRHPLVNHFARFPRVVPFYFSEEWDQPDLRHFNWRGHRDYAYLIGSMLRDTACSMVSDPNYFPAPANHRPEGIREEEPDESFDHKVKALYGEDAELALRQLEADWPEDTRSWIHQPQPWHWKRDGEGEQDGEAKPEGEETKEETPQPPMPPPEIMPGWWQRPVEYGMLPRINGMEGWNADLNHRVPPFHPTCKSTHAEEPKFNLTPSWSENWEYWVHPEHEDKPYYVSKTPGAQVKFEIDTSVGVIKVYSLFSHDLHLGKCKCWVDDNKEDGKVIDGRWGNDANIGQLTTLTTNVAAGTHTVTCEILMDTSDPDGDHEFRLIGIMGG